MSTMEMSKAIGCEGLLTTNELQVAVTIIDVKHSYGRKRYVVTPLHGHGTATVDSSRITFKEGV